MALESINPANGRLLRRFEPLTTEAIQQKISVAVTSFRDYATVPINHRALCLRKLASLLSEDSNTLAETITAEMGKPLQAARAEIDKCAGACRYYAENAPRMLAPELIGTDAMRSYVRWDPLGVVLAVMPWNFPFWQVFRFLAPALMAGNATLLKHAPNVPQCALAIEELVRRAGFQRGIMQALLIEASQVDGVLADERIAAVTLTGSEAAGRAVGAQAGWLIKKSVLELGGSDPFLVLESADLGAAVENAVRARCMNSGQSCIAAKRFIVHKNVFEEFQSKFVAGMAAVRCGDPMLEETEMGPIATARVRDHLEAQVEAAIAAGGRVLTGGKRIPGEGLYYEPTVLVDVPRTAAVYRDEIFGPVAMLFSARDLDEAIEIANDTPFGLGASAWTRDPAEQQRLIVQIEAGSVFLNKIVASDPRLPFGGIKRSGYGRELSAAGMREFMNAKTVVIA